MDKADQHFKKVFYLLASCMLLAFAYIYLITFIPIPKENVRFADTTQGFLLGTVIAGILGYYIGDSVSKKPSVTGKPGTTTAEVNISATAQSDDTSNENNNEG